jgi:hypothetical protein
MKRKHITSLITVSILVLLYAAFGPPLARCLKYSMVIKDHPGAFSTLGTIPTRLDLPSVSADDGLALGYAKTNIDPQTIQRISYPNNVVIIECNDCEYFFVTPQATPNDIPVESQGWTLFERKEFTALLELPNKDFFEFQVRALSVQPKTYSEIFHMRHEEFDCYFLSAFYKSFLLRPGESFGVFETDYTKGIVRFSENQVPPKIAADIYSKDASINQMIVLRASSLEKARQVLLTLLASYQFTIDDLPGPQQLENITTAQLKKYRATELVIEKTEDPVE